MSRRELIAALQAAGVPLHDILWAHSVSAVAAVDARLGTLAARAGIDGGGPLVRLPGGGVARIVTGAEDLEPDQDGYVNREDLLGRSRAEQPPATPAQPPRGAAKERSPMMSYRDTTTPEGRLAKAYAELPAELRAHIRSPHHLGTVHSMYRRAGDDRDYERSVKTHVANLAKGGRIPGGA